MFNNRDNTEYTINQPEKLHSIANDIYLEFIEYAQWSWLIS